MTKLRASDIATELGQALDGDDFDVAGPAPLDDPQPHALCFTKTSKFDVGGIRPLLIVGPLDLAAPMPGVSVIRVESPRQAFATAARKFFPVLDPEPGIHPTALVAASARIEASATIGPFVVIEDDCRVGAKTVVLSHGHLAARTIVGERCLIGSQTVIGQTGYGFETDENGLPFRIPHRGNVVIGNDVEIGALVSIARGTLASTVIDDHVKIDDHVFIAHNVIVGKAAMIIAGAEVSGSVVIGEGAWIAPQATVRNGIQIGARSTVGLGAVVVKDVEPDTTVLGNPARPR